MKTHLILAASALMVASQALAQPPAGLWDATVIVNDVAIPFRFELSGTAPNLRGAFFNGDDKVPSTGGHFESGTLLLNFDQYAAKLEASWKDGALSGEYTRSKRPYAFHAAPAAPSSAAVSAEKVPPIDGPWEFEATSSKGESAWRFVARQSGAQVSAAILRVDGDTGALQGTWRDGKFVLSHFDGARPLLLEVTPQADGTLALLLNGNQKYTAVRSAEARAKNVPAPTDPATHTSVKDPSEPFHFSFRDLAGNIVSDTDPRFRDKVVIVAIGGSWCPNCHDEAPFLAELYRKYRSRGVEIVALSFEEGDQLQNPTRLRAFMKEYGIDYTVLLGGVPDDRDAKLTQPVNLNSWPTTFFLGRDGRVRFVHAGFPGPASGALYRQAVKEFYAQVESLLAEKLTSSTR
jgi:thiol-disulfide isomerase/thioredoxin